MACEGDRMDSTSISSSLLHKQDEFWENIIIKYEKAIRQLKKDEILIRQRLFGLKVLFQGVLTFNLIKLLDKGGDPQTISRLVHLKCICPKHVKEEMPINIESIQFTFDIEYKDMKYMGLIKELIRRERQLIDDVNKLRIKDTILSQMKIDMDNIMKTSFPTMFATDSTPSDLPNEIQNLLQENRTLNDELCDILKENRKSEDSLNGALANELRRLKKKNALVEVDITKMKQELYNMMEESNVAVMKDILEKTWCVRTDMHRLVDALQGDVDILKEFIITLKELQ